jgi:iron complex outermembrane receptor protein
MKHTVSRLAICASLLATGSLLLPVTAFAEDQAPAASPDNGIVEIIVTATKRATTAQKTPVAMTVYSADVLQAAGVHDMAALATIDPSINITKSSGAAYVAVRGIASADTTEIGDPSVPIARDGFFVNRSFNIATSLYDLERVEVLKGPQGTLFGRNSTGGLISIVTAKPKKSFGGDVSVTVGDYSQRTVDGNINLPLNDKMQLRIAGFASKHDGYRTLTTVNSEGDDEDVSSARATLAFQPFEHFKGLATIQVDKIGGVGDVAMDQPLGHNDADTGEDLSTTPSFSAKQAKTFDAYQPSATDTHSTRYRLELTYDNLPLGMTLYYAGGYDHSTWHHTLDASSSAEDLTQFVQTERPDTWNNEIRIASPDNNRFTYQFGYFNFKETNNVDSGLVKRSGLFDGLDLIHFNYLIETKSEAFFATAGYKFTDNLKLTIGARSTHDTKVRTGEANLDLTVASGGYLAIPYNGCYFGPPPEGGCSHINIITPGNGSVDQSKPTYHLGLDWNWDTNKLLYAKFDTGYKSGGFNSNGSAPSVPYGPETMQAFEVGSKNRFFDNHLQLNLDVFHQDYSGYQASQTTSALGGAPGIQNAGDATIDGLEVEAVSQTAAIGRVSFNASFLNTEFDDFTAVDASGASLSIGGNKLPNAPDFSAGLSWEKDFHGAGGTWTPHADVKTSSSYYYTFFNFNDTKQEAYTTGNVALTYTPDSEKWSLQAFIHNVSDEVVLTNAARNLNSNFDTYQFAPPRTYGVKLSVHY